jgi:protein gp37
MNKTGIEWCSMSWNVLRGCSWASPGCDRCYAEQIAVRFSKPGQPFQHVVDKDTKTWNGTLEFIEHKLDEPLRMKTPQLVFANSMSDICHPEVKPEWIDAIFYHMTGAEQHFYLMLTKRPNLIEKKFWGPRADGWKRFYTEHSWPGRLAMGTSIEHGKFTWRACRLLEQWPGDCFLSIEPLIDQFSIKPLLQADQDRFGGKIKQVIVGGETGSGARAMHPDWVRQLRDETKAAGRAFFFKQWGTGLFGHKYLRELGRSIDGREWNESPWPVPLRLCLKIGWVDAI